MRVTTDAAGSASFDIDLHELPTSRSHFPAEGLTVVAKWIDPTRAAVVRTLFVPRSAARLQISTSLAFAATPGVEFAILATVPGVREHRGTPVATSLTASVSFVKLTAPICEQLAFCTLIFIGMRPREIRDGHFEQPPVVTQRLSAADRDLLLPQATAICDGYPVDQEDWEACRFALPAVGSYLLIACADDACFAAFACVSSLLLCANSSTSCVLRASWPASRLHWRG